MSNTITHHPPEALLHAYQNGVLGYGDALVIATHISICDPCREFIEAEDIIGGVFLETTRPVAPEPRFYSRVQSAISRAKPMPLGLGHYPEAVASRLGSGAPKWQSLGLDVRQSIIAKRPDGTVRLLRIGGGKPVPEHGHQGRELTLVLEGAFSDVTGTYQRGDLQIANAELEHQPVACPGEDCLCLASTNGQLVFKSLIPRLLQGFFQI